MANVLKMSEGVVTTYLNGLELTSDTTDVQISIPRTVQNKKTFGEAQIIPSTHHDVSATVSFVNDYADDTLDEVTWAEMTSTAQSALTVGVGTAAGDRAYTLLGHVDSRALPVSLDDAIMLNGSINAESIIRGRYLCRNQAITATGSLTGIRFTESNEAITATQTEAAVLHVTADTVTSWTIVIQKSTDSTNGVDGTWNSVTGLSFTTAAVGHEIDLADAGATLAANDWLRVNCTAFSGTTGTITIVAGRLED